MPSRWPKTKYPLTTNCRRLPDPNTTVVKIVPPNHGARFSSGGVGFKRQSGFPYCTLS